MNVRKLVNKDKTLTIVTDIQTVGELKKLLADIPDDLSIDVNGAYDPTIYIINIKDAGGETTVSFNDEDSIEVEDYIDTYNLKSVE